MRNEGNILTNSLKFKLKTLINQNLKQIIIISAFFLAGFLFAQFAGTNEIEPEEIKVYFSDFFTNISDSGTDPKASFYAAMLSNLKFAVVLFLSSVTIVGIPVIYAFTLLNGISFGLVIHYLFYTFGIKALLLLLTMVIPHTIVLAPLSVMYANCCLVNANMLFKEHISIRKRVVKPALLGLLFLLLSGVSALIQAYLEPFFTHLIQIYFTSR